MIDLKDWAESYSGKLSENNYSINHSDLRAGFVAGCMHVFKIIASGKNIDKLIEEIGVLMVEAVQKVLDEGIAMYGLQKNVTVVEVRKDNRITLAYTRDPLFPEFHEHMIKLERYMKIALGTNLYLVLESREDRNKRDAKTERL